jgi:transketolase
MCHVLQGRAIMSNFEQSFLEEQQKRNENLIDGARYIGDKIESKVIPFFIDIKEVKHLSAQNIEIVTALEKSAARTAIKTLASLAEINELDHLGGGLDLISAFTLTVALTDFDKIEYTIENAHTSIGYFSVLSAFGFMDENYVVEKFRRSIDIAGHVSWVAGGTQLNGGRLGVMIPTAVGQALGKKALKRSDTWIITHCGDAGWISGQALNGYNAANLHGAPITFVMHRNGIQLSGSNKQIMNKDPRPIIKSLGITIFEIPSLHEVDKLYLAYREAYSLAREGLPSMIYPVGFKTNRGKVFDLKSFGEKYAISDEVKAFAETHHVALDREIWIPGSLMSYRDVEPMLECLFLVNDLEGGKGHHDGHMKGRSASDVLANPMLQLSETEKKQLKVLREQQRREITTSARPIIGSENLILADDLVRRISLPEPGKNVSPRAGSEIGYETIAKTYPDKMFVIGCDLDTSTKLLKARKHLPEDHQFEMSIEEQASALMANGLAMSSDQPQLNVFSTFAAFFEGIAREGFELWRYQRNLNGINEGLNVTFHLSHVGACTGRDHFSGWSLDWINLAISYLPYLHRFYAPADVRAAFLAVRDLAAHYGGHIIGIPRDNLPVLTRQDDEKPLWQADSPWESITKCRVYNNAEYAILAFGAPAFLAVEASEKLIQDDRPTDVFIINGLPLDSRELHKIFKDHPGGIVTIEDGIISTRQNGLRGFASVIASNAFDLNLALEHIGIVDPRIAPSDDFREVWDHFGLTTKALVSAVKSL